MAAGLHVSDSCESGTGIISTPWHNFYSMGKDEQKEEREVLDSIFPDEITDLSDTSYRISITLEGGGEEDEAQPVILLRVSYPEEYPDVAPDLEISAPPNAPKYSNLDIQTDRASLLESLQPSIEENMGMAMVFTLVSTLKDSAELLIEERRKAAQAIRDVEAAQVEEEENRKFHGTAVTRASFLEWRESFRHDMVEEERRRQEDKELEDKKKRVVKEEKRMTGKELWERGLVGKIEEDDEGEDALESLKIDE